MSKVNVYKIPAEQAVAQKQEPMYSGELTQYPASPSCVIVKRAGFYHEVPLSYIRDCVKIKNGL